MRNQNAEPSSTLLVKGVPHDCTEEDLRNAFEAWTNDVTSCRVIKDKSTNQARGFAFVEFVTCEAAKGVMEDPRINVLKVAGSFS